MVNSTHCRHHADDALPCLEPAEQGDLCFWHSSSADKSSTPLADALQAYVRRHRAVSELQLKRANLAGVDLVNRNHKGGFTLHRCDLYRADLRGAHLFSIDLRGSSLMKADLREANLHCADLRGCNLLGAKWHDARIDTLHIGEQILQEQQAYQYQRAGKSAKAHEAFEQAEEIYRDLRKAAEAQGLFEFGGRCLHKELTMRRYQFPLLSAHRFISKMIDLFCGYGERPLRVVIFALLLMLCCALFYFIFGLRHGDQMLVLSLHNSLLDNLYNFVAAIYFSIVTFTTLGYGDITPIGYSRLIAAFEAFTGSFTIALFVVVFVKKMTR